MYTGPVCQGLFPYAICNVVQLLSSALKNNPSVLRNKGVLLTGDVLDYVGPAEPLVIDPVVLLYVHFWSDSAIRLTDVTRHSRNLALVVDIHFSDEGRNAGLNNGVGVD